MRTPTSAGSSHERSADRPEGATKTQRHRLRVLVVGEAVTLAHIGRPLSLIDHLGDEYDIIFAADPRFRALYPEYQGDQHPLWSIPVADFLDALRQGRPVYDRTILRRYVRDDLQLLERTQPDLVVGDFRLSLAVSARVAAIPYISLVNAHWSPHITRILPLPDIPITRALGSRVIAWPLFQLAWPVLRRIHARPLNSVADEHGLGRPFRSVMDVYTAADHTAFVDSPTLFPRARLPSSCSFLGPLNWEPAIPPPPWWNDLPQHRPVVYVTLGTSGASELLGSLLPDLCRLPITILVATAGREGTVPDAENVFAAPYLPGTKAARRAHLVICNGGSGTVYQSLSGGAGVIGVCSNLDQLLTMQSVERAGAGWLFRAHRLKLDKVVARVKRQLDLPPPELSLAHCDVRSNFSAIVSGMQEVGAPAKPQ